MPQYKYRKSTMSVRQQIIMRALIIFEKEGIEAAINWVLDNTHDYYKNEVERLERKLAIRDRLLFNKQFDEVSYEPRRIERETFEAYPEED